MCDLSSACREHSSLCVRDYGCNVLVGTWPYPVICFFDELGIVWHLNLDQQVAIIHNIK